MCVALVYVTCTHGVAPARSSRLRTLARSLAGCGRVGAGWLGLRATASGHSCAGAVARAALAPLLDVRSLRRPCCGALVGRAGVRMVGGCGWRVCCTWCALGTAWAAHDRPWDIRRNASVGTCEAPAWPGRMTLVRGRAPRRPGADGRPRSQENIRARGARARARSARARRGNVRSKLHHSAYFYIGMNLKNVST